MWLILGQSGLDLLHKQILKFGNLSTETKDKLMVFSHSLYKQQRDPPFIFYIQREPVKVCIVSFVSRYISMDECNTILSAYESGFLQQVVFKCRFY